MTDGSVRGRVLHAGSATATAIHLDAPLSFWGGFDPASGRIVDQAHPQVGESLTGRIVVLPGSRGSSATPGVLAESLRRKTGPVALIVQKADINLAAGAVVAEALYDRTCPIVLLDDDSFAQIRHWPDIAIAPDGAVGRAEATS